MNIHQARDELYEFGRFYRNRAELVNAAHHAGVPIGEIAELSGLSRQTVARFIGTQERP